MVHAHHVFLADGTGSDKCQVINIYLLSDKSHCRGLWEERLKDDLIPCGGPGGGNQKTGQTEDTELALGMPREQGEGRGGRSAFPETGKGGEAWTPGPVQGHKTGRW